MPRDEQGDIDRAWLAVLATLPDRADLLANPYHLVRSRELFEAGWISNAPLGGRGGCNTTDITSPASPSAVRTDIGRESGIVTCPRCGGAILHYDIRCSGTFGGSAEVTAKCPSCRKSVLYGYVDEWHIKDRIKRAAANAGLTGTAPQEDRK